MGTEVDWQGLRNVASWIPRCACVRSTAERGSVLSIPRSNSTAEAAPPTISESQPELEVRPRLDNNALAAVSDAC